MLRDASIGLAARTTLTLTATLAKTDHSRTTVPLPLTVSHLPCPLALILNPRMTTQLQTKSSVQLSG